MFCTRILEVLIHVMNVIYFVNKAVGEPAICMSVVILFALRYAINAARKDAGLPKKWLPLSSATTPEQVFMNCGNKITDFTL